MKEFFLAQLYQGATPHGLALSFTVGFLIGHFPLFGTTTALAVIFGVIFRLNQPVLQLTTQLMGITHLIMIPIFLRFGEWLVGAPPMSLNPQAVIDSFFASIPDFFRQFGMAGLHAALGWAVVAPFAGVLVFYYARFLFNKLFNKMKLQSRGSPAL